MEFDSHKAYDPFKYHLYGITLSSNRALPGLLPVTHDQNVLPDITLCLQGNQHKFSPNPTAIYSGLDVISKPDGDYYRVWFQGDGEIIFEINSAGNFISVDWTRSKVEEITTLLVGQVIACALRLQGKLCLHACVIQMDEQAIALIGESGAGKSTMAAFFAQQGYAVLADDVAALQRIDDHYQVQLGYPRLRLWPKSVHALYNDKHALDPIFSFSEKSYLSLSAKPSNPSKFGTFSEQPLPLAAIYILHKRQPNLTAPYIQLLPPSAALMALLQHRSVSHLPLDKPRQQAELEQLTYVIQTIPVKQLHRPDNLQDLQAVYEVVRADLAL